MQGEAANIVKADTCTECINVEPTGISRKVARITPGGLHACHVLPTSRGVGMGWVCRSQPTP